MNEQHDANVRQSLLNNEPSLQRDEGTSNGGENQPPPYSPQAPLTAPARPPPAYSPRARPPPYSLHAPQAAPVITPLTAPQAPAAPPRNHSTIQLDQLNTPPTTAENSSGSNFLSRIFTYLLDTDITPFMIYLCICIIAISIAIVSTDIIFDYYLGAGSFPNILKYIFAFFTAVILHFLTCKLIPSAYGNVLDNKLHSLISLIEECGIFPTFGAIMNAAIIFSKIGLDNKVGKTINNGY